MLQQSEQLSAYCKKLQEENREIFERYMQKLKLINDVDPYMIRESDLSIDTEGFPPVGIVDIISYLVLTTSYYTKQQMEAYKSLQSYKYFESGFVSRCGYIEIANKYLIIGNVKHSQRMNEPPLRPWIICNRDGSVETGHCTCMAGAGEVCSHVGAILFTIQFINNSKNSTSCTDLLATWNVPKTKKVEYETLRGMNYGKISSTDKYMKRPVPALAGKELEFFLRSIEQIGKGSALAKVTEPFVTEFVQQRKQIIQNPYTNLYNENFETLSYVDLLELCSDVHINLSDETVQNLEKATRKQSNCDEWYCQRTGRITASILKSVSRANIGRPPLSLIKRICYSSKFLFKTAATEWGKRNEKTAIEAFRGYALPSHENLTISEVGFIIRSECPQFGASPDAIVSCSCCGKGCIEVKCPYLLKELTIVEFAKHKNSCLSIDENEQINLDEKHAYFFQMQMQMALTKTAYCDFVIWSPKHELYHQRIIFNEDFWHYHSTRAEVFHKKIILPELLARYFTRDGMNRETWCLCQEIDDGRPMILCDGEKCDIRWYHLECVHLNDVPMTVWLCQACQSSVE